ncbi:methyltransferase family protein [Flavisolibacter ginsenosidimutans]|uniref:DUF1295 domain-containing protein n=1 Tax=Flavisolibacter ginsenosidimutans TaxID=661481 RepID=A0A5B8UE18_9BACT|nr:NnrU family protein [Flavisolibacter ginsenosidimutans]QEC54814.1 DUF1295 domain-containing protein [Flavisolibacter ginsenosidimutans]
MLLNHVLLGLSWIVYCVLHSVFASLQVKNFFKKILGDGFRHYRLAYTVFAFAGLALILWFQFSIRSPRLFKSSWISDIAGAAFCIPGLLLMFICIKKYFLNLSGLRSLVEEETRSILEVKGVHRFVRHPLYLGTFLFIWGLLILFPTASLLLTDVVITVYTLIGLELEERKLLLQFGEQYRTYQKKVPKLVPKF